jgi:hypothetical protein
MKGIKRHNPETLQMVAKVLLPRPIWYDSVASDPFGARGLLWTNVREFAQFDFHGNPFPVRRPSWPFLVWLGAGEDYRPDLRT